MEADQSFDEDDVEEEEEEEEEEEDVKTSKKRPAPSLTAKSQVCFTPFELVQSYRWLQVMCFNVFHRKKGNWKSKRMTTTMSECCFSLLLWSRFILRFIITDLFCRDDEEGDEDDDDDDEEEEEDIEESPVKARLFSGSSVVCI